MLVLYFLLLALFILFAGFYAGVETGSYSLSRLKLRYRLEEGLPEAKILSRLLANRQRLICTILVGHNLFVYLATALVTRLYRGHYSLHLAQIVSTITLAPVIFIFAEIMPKNFFRVHANTLMYLAASLLSLSSKVFRPIVALLQGVVWFWNRLLKLTRRQEATVLTRESLRFYFLEGRDAGTLTSYQDILARNIMALGGVSVGTAMVPLAQVAAVEASWGSEQIKDLARDTNFSRFPIYENIKRNIVGVLNIYDLLWGNGEGGSARDFLRPAIFLNQDTSVAAGLYQLRRSKQPMGIVITKAGRPVGVVTIKDLVEEIVGELEAW
jgi:CBS domain containing-hemolysin-like protein